MDDKKKQPFLENSIKKVLGHNILRIAYLCGFRDIGTSRKPYIQVLEKKTVIRHNMLIGGTRLGGTRFPVDRRDL